MRPRKGGGGEEEEVGGDDEEGRRKAPEEGRDMEREEEGGRTRRSHSERGRWQTERRKQRCSVRVRGRGQEGVPRRSERREGR